jgi:ACS family hexuronate transporter-like MFS transporter
LLGGYFSSWLVHRGNSLNLARKLGLGVSAACMPWVFLVTKFPAEAAIVLFSIAFFGQQSWSTLVMTLPADIFPRRLVGSVAGLVGFGGAIGGVIFNLAAGRILESLGRQQGYLIVFGMTSSFHILAFLLILATVRRVEPIEIAP